MIQNYYISFEGIDKSGKDIVRKYVNILGNYKYVLMDRGLLSNIVYSKLYNRDYNYDITQFKQWIIVLLKPEYEDWKIRCKLTNEAYINYDENIKLFNQYAKELQNNGIKILEYNTTKLTPYTIAKNIIENIEKLNVK